LARDALDAFKKVVGNFDGCFHNMAAHIRMDGRPYQAAFPPDPPGIADNRSCSACLQPPSKKPATRAAPTALCPRAFEEWHVATAAVPGTKNFYTFDTRQKSLALKAGMKVMNLDLARYPTIVYHLDETLLPSGHCH
jgi:hypothetical protein